MIEELEFDIGWYLSIVDSLVYKYGSRNLLHIVDEWEGIKDQIKAIRLGLA